jgi:metal-dependent amidase/aminoacylase/carboxypeptidase family protein
VPEQLASERAALEPELIETRRALHRQPAEEIGAGFVAIGAGGEGCGAHHAPDFDIDERAIGVTAEVLVRAAIARLGSAT